jgi:hypothetical protein
MLAQSSTIRYRRPRLLSVCVTTGTVFSLRAKQGRAHYADVACDVSSSDNGSQPLTPVIPQRDVSPTYFNARESDPIDSWLKTNLIICTTTPQYRQVQDECLVSSPRQRRACGYA